MSCGNTVTPSSTVTATGSRSGSAASCAPSRSAAPLRSADTSRSAIAAALQQVAYNSCRNRHCPKCRASAAAEWVEARESELLPVEYFHVVFTLPATLAPVALQNQRVVYGLLFRAAAETLQQIAADPKHLGADIGFLAVLHTWGQNLQHHPHVHCVVPGGGLSPDGTRWIACRPAFFLPVRVLSRLFRGKFLALLRGAFEQGKLSFHGTLAALADAGAFRRALAATGRAEWIVYAKPPFGGPHQVLKYLAATPTAWRSATTG